MIVEVALTGATAWCAYVTQCDKEERAKHVRLAATAAKVAAMVPVRIVITSHRAIRLVAVKVRHHGVWLMWQVGIILPRRVVVHQDDE